MEQLELAPATITATQLAVRAVAEESAYQKEAELAALAELLVAALPERPRILEIGVGAGGTVWLWRRLWPQAEIVAVDIQAAPCPGCAHGLAHNGCPRRRIAGAVSKFVLADSQDAPLVLTSIGSDPFDFIPFDFLHVDGAHDYEACRHDVDSYAPLVTKGGLVALHDTLGYPGVAQVWTEIERAAPERCRRLEAEPRDWGGYGVVTA